jgi:ammonium transporter, Amt family
MSLFDECVAESIASDLSRNDTVDSLEPTSILQCVASKLESAQAAAEADKTSWILVLAGALVFFMQAGFAMLCAGCVRKKNVQNTMLKNLLDACGAAIAWYSVGFAFSFGGHTNRTDTTFIGTTHFFSLEPEKIDFAFWWFEYAFCAAATTIVAGTLAERCQMAAYLCYSLFITGFVYPVVVHAIWSSNGFLSAFHVDPLWGVGAIDFAGSGCVHVTGGMTALIAVIILGPRKGRFYDSRGRLLAVPKAFPGHSVALQLMGTMVLWFGCKLHRYVRMDFPLVSIIYMSHHIMPFV